MSHIRTLALSVLIAVPLGAQSAPTRPLDPQNVDRRYGACEDFYMFANNGWIERNPIPSAFASWGTFNELSERNTLVLKGIAERAAAQAATSTDSSTRKLGTFYASCMDSATVERTGIGPIADELARIEAISDRTQLQTEIARLHMLGYGGTFSFGAAADAKNATRVIANASQGGLTLPDREYYLRADTEGTATRDRLVSSVASMLSLAGDPAPVAESRAQHILALETSLARSQISRVAMRDPNARYHPMTVEQANAQAPGFDWRRYLADIGLPNVTVINLGTPEFFTALGNELTTRPLDDWKAYLRWTVVNRSASQLGAPFADESFRLAAMLTGARVQLPRWKRCLVATDQLLGDALGREYVKTEFSPEAREKMGEIVGNLRSVLRDRIHHADWMSEGTRAEALRKLDAFGQKVGYPDSWNDYAGLDIAAVPYAENVRRTRSWLFQHDVMRIGRSVDREQWLMTTPTVNAYYSAQLNEIVFPAGRLQPPFFSASYDEAANYGGIGATVGHEMSHGFDDAGRQFDAAGNVRDWWAPEDARHYRARASVVERQYSAYVAIDTLHLNGRLTLGENIADVVGVSLAYEALERALDGKSRDPIDGFTPEQRFFLAYAQARLSVLRPESARLLLTTDPHSPGRFRVNGPLSNMPEFARAFGCKEGDPMVRSEETRARIW
jgi:putative endopeptidase